MKEAGLVVIFVLSSAIIGVSHFSTAPIETQIAATRGATSSGKKENDTGDVVRSRVSNSKVERKRAAQRRTIASKAKDRTAPKRISQKVKPRKRMPKRRPIASDTQPQEKKQPVSLVLDRRVRVYLKSGAQFEGVIKKDRFAEKKSRGVYVRAKSYREPGAGVRLWYVRQSKGFLFIPFTSIRRIRKLGLTDSRLEERRSALASERARKYNRRRRQSKRKSRSSPHRVLNQAFSISRSSNVSRSNNSRSRRTPLLRRSSGGTGC